MREGGRTRWDSRAAPRGVFLEGVFWGCMVCERVLSSVGVGLRGGLVDPQVLPRRGAIGSHFTSLTFNHDAPLTRERLESPCS